MLTTNHYHLTSTSYAILKFEEGQRVVTPDGPGEAKIKVKLNSGVVKEYPTDKLSHDSAS